MTWLDEHRVQAAASTAASLGALSGFLAEALAAQPETALASEAVEMLAEVATRLGEDLNRLLSGEAA